LKTNFKIEKTGISGIARLRNEEEYLPIILDRFLPFLDEIILVCDKGNTDNTPDICEDYRRRYPDIIKTYYYPYEVYPPLSKETLFCKEADPRALWNYNNWAFSKATRSFSMKVDGDLIPRADLMNYKDLIWDIVKKSYIVELHGANLIIDNDKLKVFSPPESNIILCGMNDHFLRHNDISNFFGRQKSSSCEVWCVPYLPKKFNKGFPYFFFYYHMRWCKKDICSNRGNMGISNSYYDHYAYYKDSLKIDVPEAKIDWESWIISYKNIVDTYRENYYNIDIGIPDPNIDTELIKYMKDKNLYNEAKL